MMFDPRLGVRRASVAPHLRAPTSFARTQAFLLVALLPVLAASVYVTGWQYLQAVRSLHVIMDDWRADWILMPLFSGSDILFIVWAGLVHVAPVLGLAYATGLAWEALFARLRRRQREGGLLPIAIVFTALLPPSVPLLHVAIGMSAAIVLGKEVFGGHGKTFLPPALVGVAVLQVSYPLTLAAHPLWEMVSGYAGTSAFAMLVGGDFHASYEHALTYGSIQGAMGTTYMPAVLVGFVLLLLSHTVNWRGPAGVVLGVLAIGSLNGGFAVEWHFLVGGLVFGAVFIATDPASTPSTNLGRWLYGFLAGAMVVLIRLYHPSHPDATVAAFLFAAVMAPMIDAAIVRLQVRWARVQAKRRRAML